MVKKKETILEITGESFACQCCGKALDEKKPEDVFFDEFLWKIFGYMFCDQRCRDDYVNSK